MDKADFKKLKKILAEKNIWNFLFLLEENYLI